MSDRRNKRPLDYVLKGNWFPVAIFSLVAVLTMLDIGIDLAAGTTVHHVLVESLLVLVAVAGTLYFWARLREASRAERKLKRSLEEARAENERWQEEERELLYNLQEAVDRQFIKWDFSDSEKEIAYCLLQGLSMKEIAGLRGSTYRSIKQQAYVLYHKAGLAGRAELSAFFLGGLLQRREQAESEAA